MKMTLSRKDFQELQNFERAARGEIQVAIEEILEEVEARAQDVWVGRHARFGHRWHASEDLVVIDAPVSRVVVSASDDGSTVYIEFEFKALDPRSGRQITLTRVPSTVTFVD
jgi:hypothetical protein